MNPLPKDMTTETPLTDKKWIWGTGMDGSPIEVVSAEFARRLEMDRARLRDVLKDLLDQVESLNGYELTRDIESYKAQACWDDAIDKAGAILSELERNEK
jgi:hypothetical protein